MITLDPSAPFDPALAKALAQFPVVNGTLARSDLPVLLDVLQTQSHWSLCPVIGIGGRVSTTARNIRVVVPPFVRYLRPMVVAAGDGVVTVDSVSGATGTVTITGALDSGSKDPWDASPLVADSVLTLTAGDVCRDIVISVVIDSTDIAVFAIALICEGNTL